MKAFFGTFINKLDAKGRVSVPAPFRAAIQARGLTSVAIHPSLFDNCLEGAGFDRFENLDAQITDTFVSTAGNDAADLIMGELRDLPLDGEGRIVLPAEFIAKANLKDQVAFIGQGRKFQIWEPAALDAVKRAKLARVSAAMNRDGDA
jgi:MraZ protein